ncbi:highly divergent homeobox isoform X1 [Pygocentrus nattereri]|uniref:Homeobox domain-containing protein n=1 Tax=Pygocentrus nattereri TaxID=42514 RepID=A0AAR2KMW4_PYGNA|nr:highly divergent homeobox isoform X1 [Pygocentrus nattereri]XP_037396313.1 highly divergent homeobox isoform X1 [Pygocentrus nattereri]
METWQEKRSIQTMNLRSVFTAEQQRILERYYENGMTNQSKSCFQLILQCAQEAKLDFSVVRTWVGNKRRKLASKADKNGVVGLSNHALAGPAGALVAGSVLTAEMAAVRAVQRGPAVAHLLPPPASCPSSSSSPSSCSPLSSGSGTNNNNDVIVTGTYSLLRSANRLDSSSQSRTGPKAVPTQSDPEPSPQARPALHPDAVSLHSAAIALQRKAPHIPTSSALLFSQMRRTFSPREPVAIPPNWAKQYGTPQNQSWPSISHQQTLPIRNSPPASTSDSGLKIQQVYTIAGLGEASQRSNPGTSQDRSLKKPHPPDTSETFSIAMETGDVEDEYSREEELANMGAQIQLSKSTSSSVSTAEGNRNSSSGPSLIDSRGMYAVTGRNQSTAPLSSPNSALFGEKGCQTNSSLLLGTASGDGYPFRLFSQTSPTRIPTLKVSSMSAPWLLSNSRKRTLQDRTQFSDGDLYTLKRYWDNGMTSLGSVCREKISAAATELNVDSEIIKTWIGNRRRKYRLMGIEIPPPKGGPATFPKVASAEPPSPLTPEEDEPRILKPAEDSEQNDVVSLCMSEDGTSDSYLKENDDGHDGSTNSALAENVKIEIIDEEEDDDDDDDDGELMATDMEQMHSLLEYKHEEVQYLESELENQKQKYYELRTFTKSLLKAMKNNDLEKQQELLASLPQQVEEDLGLSPERDAESSMEMTSSQKDSSVSEGEGDTHSHTLHTVPVEAYK